MKVEWLQNLTGVTIPKGSVVKASVAADNAVVLTAASGLDPVGIAYRDIPTGTWGPIVVSGLAQVLVDNAGQTNREDWIGVSAATAGYGTCGIIPFPPNSDNHFREIGHATEARVGAGLVWAIVHFN